MGYMVVGSWVPSSGHCCSLLNDDPRSLFVLRCGIELVDWGGKHAASSTGEAGGDTERCGGPLLSGQQYLIQMVEHML